MEITHISLAIKSDFTSASKFRSLINIKDSSALKEKKKNATQLRSPLLRLRGSLSRERTSLTFLAEKNEDGEKNSAAEIK